MALPSSTVSYLEHVNLTVADHEAAANLVLCAFPDWKIRGRGEYDVEGYDVGASWLHVGNDYFYLSITKYPDGHPLSNPNTSIQHAGFVVPDVDEVKARMDAAGFATHDIIESAPSRRRLYCQIPAESGGETESHSKNMFQIECIEYLSDDPAVRNDYDV